MQKFTWCRRLLSLVMAAILVLPMLGNVVWAEETQPEEVTKADMVAAVEPQVRAFAKSINQKNADTEAAADLAAHGLAGRGKTLKMDASDPLTATLVNSELVQKGFSVMIADIICTMQRLDMPSVPGIQMTFGWYGSQSDYGAYVLTDSDVYPDNLDWMVTSEPFTGKLNSYDNSLEWMVGQANTDVTIQCIGDNGSEKSYKVTVKFADRFDFSIAGTSGFKKLFSGLGMLLFKEFDWNCTVTLNLTVPYSLGHCSHSSGAYHWTYDSENCAMIPDGTGSYLQNHTTHRSETAKDGTIHHFYELDNTIRLFHDKPWVLEYDVCKPRSIVFAPVCNAVTKTHPQIAHSSTVSLYAVSKDYAMAENTDGSLDRFYAYNYFGTGFQNIAQFTYGRTYTFRLENVIANDGSNGIFLTVRDAETGVCILDRIPMDDHYYYGGWMDKKEFVSENSDWLNGKDIHINYIGSAVTGFGAETFDLRIWENGQNAPNGDYFTETRYPSTCTEDGYTVRNCRLCGIQERVDPVPSMGHDWVAADCLTAKTCQRCEVTEGAPAGHRYSDWEIRIQPACLKDGLRIRVCQCGAEETEVIPALKHDYQNGRCKLCKEKDPDFVLGDVDGDRTLTYNDALIVLRYSIDLESLDAIHAADVNFDGDVTYDDALRILRASIGLGDLIW